jgi:hypothetical protein
MTLICSGVNAELLTLQCSVPPLPKRIWAAELPDLDQVPHMGHLYCRWDRHQGWESRSPEAVPCLGCPIPLGGSSSNFLTLRSEIKFQNTSIHGPSKPKPQPPGQHALKMRLSLIFSRKLPPLQCLRSRLERKAKYGSVMPVMICFAQRVCRNLTGCYESLMTGQTFS